MFLLILSNVSRRCDRNKILAATQTITTRNINYQQMKHQIRFIWNIGIFTKYMICWDTFIYIMLNYWDFTKYYVQYLQMMQCNIRKYLLKHLNKKKSIATRKLKMCNKVGFRWNIPFSHMWHIFLIIETYIFFIGI